MHEEEALFGMTMHRPLPRTPLTGRDMQALRPLLDPVASHLGRDLPRTVGDTIDLLTQPTHARNLGCHATLD